MIRFEKVSFKQFYKDYIDTYYNGQTELPETASEEFVMKEIYSKIELPRRSSVGSAGYDFFLPFNARLDDLGDLKIPTGIRAFMPDDVVLMMYPRSGLGFKNHFTLANTVGVIDSSYVNSDNEGHIFAKVRTETFIKESQLYLPQGKAFMQGIFTHYLLTDDDNTTDIRNGGFGSSDNK